MTTTGTSPERVYRQVGPMVDAEATLTGTSKIYYHNGQQGFLYSGNPQQWLGSIAFKRCLWERREFEDHSKGVDNRWQRMVKPVIYDVDDPALFIATIHPGNTCRKNTAGWKKVDYQMLVNIMETT